MDIKTKFDLDQDVWIADFDSDGYSVSSVTVTDIVVTRSHFDKTILITYYFGSDNRDEDKVFGTFEQAETAAKIKNELYSALSK